MNLEIFDVAHGACALLTCDNGVRLMIDCATNAKTGWSPGSYLRSIGISNLEMLAITNYDEDHVRGLADLLDSVNVAWLLRNRTVNAQTLQTLKSEDGMGAGIERLAKTFANYTDVESPTPNFQGVERKVFYNSYPDFDDENNLSMAIHLTINGTGFLFPGDLERPGWLQLLMREDFRQAVSRTNVLIASHHGRQSGICEEIFDAHGCRPYYVVISDKEYAYDTQQTAAYYRGKTIGGPFRGEQRHVLTTRNDGRIDFRFGASGWAPY